MLNFLRIIKGPYGPSHPAKKRPAAKKRRAVVKKRKPATRKKR